MKASPSTSLSQTTQALIIGAGPVGLFAVFELGLLDIECCLIDILKRPGGQCAELYPEKPIYDIPALPRVTGRDLSKRLLEQIAPFNPRFYLGESVSAVRGCGGEGFRVEAESGLLLNTDVVVIASGGGMFVAKKPPIPDIAHYEDISVFYAVREREKFRNAHVLIAGGGDSALDWAIDLCEIAKTTTLIHRRHDFRASPHSIRTMERLVRERKVTFRVGTISHLEGEGGRVRSVKIRDDEGREDSLAPIDYFLPFFGLTMRTGAIAEFRLDMQQGGLLVDTEAFETNRKGIFAIGDIARYPGKLKLILSGFHESALMAQKAHRYVYPERKLRFQHTTSSSSLKKKISAVSEKA